ncbi:K(+)/H(+) antiporter [Lunasporangiospora selenospora]|uniref:K(+)/H(+) antiporter n=1 Tax=Lunasporangiospora selenospora TaxID=979761 RepID=A0A9P6FVI1_9FUNG|nr:K(+)/H(+) antiporter [Lunasporangiospora selenospora]
MGSSAGSVVSGLNPTEVNPANPYPLFVIQAIIIIVLCYTLHLGLHKLKQPRVISEVIAGILLGPSVLGRIPGFATTIFNPASLAYLNMVSSLGLVLFLFLVGLELDPSLVVKRARFALGISFAGMVLPFGVGAAVSYVLYEELSTENPVGFGKFMLFTGVAMSITAFPVLARILAERKLLTTKVGFLTVCAGAVGDIVAWILLALVISIINSASKIVPLYVVLLSIAWNLILVYVVRPMFKFMIRFTKSEDEPSQTMMAFTLSVVLISAFVTDIIGVHAIFGSFLVGLIIPNDTRFADEVTKRIEDLVTVIFLPIYFALSGLKTQIGLLDNAHIWGLVILVTFVACFGKIVGCGLAARVQGMEWREAWAVGVLMNCKGLIELIVLNIGYDAGIIDARVFVIMVAMCLITTCMTTPLVSYIYPPSYQRAAALRALAKERKLAGDIESQDPTDSVDPANKGYLLCLDNIHNLPSMMTLLQSLSQLTPTEKNVRGDQDVPSIPSHPVSTPSSMSESTLAPKLSALRLLHITDRSSSVLLAGTENAEVLRRDTLMTVFKAFAKLNSILFQPRLTLSTDPTDFAKSICEEAMDTGSNVVVIPWTSSALPDPPAVVHEDGASNLVLPRPHVTSNTELVTRLLSSTINTGLTTAIYVDRELGASGHFSNIMIPLYGSYDDEEALRFASALSHNGCNIMIVRIETSKKFYQKNGQRDRETEADRQSSMSTMDGSPNIPEDNRVFVQWYFPHRAVSLEEKRHSKRNNNNSSSANNQQPITIHGEGVEAGHQLFIRTVPTIQDALNLAKIVLGPRDLLVLGRGPTNKSGRHTPELSTVETSNQLHPSSAQHLNAPGLPLHIQPTDASLSSINTSTHPMEAPLGAGVSDTHILPANASDVRHRRQQPLRHQPSSRDLYHSNMTVANTLGLIAQTFLYTELASCMMVVQSGTKLVSGIDCQRVASSVIPTMVRTTATQTSDAQRQNAQHPPTGLSAYQPPRGNRNSSDGGHLPHRNMNSEHLNEKRP